MENIDLEIVAKIAGNVVISNNPGEMLKIWRKRLKIKQIVLARKMKISPSVLSDYESGRRVSPGAGFIKKYGTLRQKFEHTSFSGLQFDLKLSWLNRRPINFLARLSRD